MICVIVWLAMGGVEVFNPATAFIWFCFKIMPFHPILSKFITRSKTKNVVDLVFVDFLNFTKLKNSRRQIFVILRIHKPSLVGSCEVPHKLWL